MSHAPTPIGPGVPTTGTPVLLIQQSPPPPGMLQRFLSWLMRSFFLLSVVLNVLLLVYVAQELNTDSSVSEVFYSGDPTAKDKVAVVRIEGAIVEGFTSFAHQQLRRAGRDPFVKAVVLAIDSPGGTVTASDELYHTCIQLREGKLPGQQHAKPLVVSMGSVAASGGYYVAVAADLLFAQPTTLTGSIGVYAQLFDVSEGAAKLGIGLPMIKKGELKGSGSPFHKMHPEEEREFSEMLEHAFRRFQSVVEEGRNQRGGTRRLKAALREPLTLTTLTTPPETYTRRLADGGIWVADQALQYGLIDHIGYLPDAVTTAAQLAGADAARLRVVRYQRPVTLFDGLLGIQVASQSERMGSIGTIRLRDLPGATARLWYLAPGFELEGIAWR